MMWPTLPLKTSSFTSSNYCIKLSLSPPLELPGTVPGWNKLSQSVPSSPLQPPVLSQSELSESEFNCPWIYLFNPQYCPSLNCQSLNSIVPDSTSSPPVLTQSDLSKSEFNCPCTSSTPWNCPSLNCPSLNSTVPDSTSSTPWNCLKSELKCSCPHLIQTQESSQSERR